MLAFIPFGLKILLASIIGGAINYVPEKSENNQSIIHTSLICIFSTSVIALTTQFVYNENYYSMGFGVFSVIMAITYLSKNLSFDKKITWFFSAVIGMIIGSGFLIQAILLTVLIYYIIHNSDIVLDYVYGNTDLHEDNLKVENNIEEIKSKNGN